MKKLFAVLGVAALLAAGAGSAPAQESDTTDHNVNIDVEEVALINDIGDDPVFTIDAPAGAVGGEAVVVTSTDEDSKWLQYTSILGPALNERKITVSIDDADNIPAGTTLTVTAATPGAPSSGLATSFSRRSSRSG